MTLAAFGLLVLCVVPLVPSAAARDRPRPSFPYALSRADAHLRFEIEEAPAELIANLASSKGICGEALQAELGGDAGGAEASWATLAKTVREGDLPAEHAIVDAFARSRSDLGDLQATFSEQWRDRPAKLRALSLGAAETQDGTRLLRRAVRRFEVAFDSWEQHDCTGAQRAVTATDRAISSAVAKVNSGMERLQSLLPSA